MEDVYGLLHDGEEHTDRHHNDLDPQALAIEWHIVGAVVLRTYHQPRDRAHDPHCNADAPLTGFFAVELYPGIVHRMVPNGESVDRRPKAPPRPLSH